MTSVINVFNYDLFYRLNVRSISSQLKSSTTAPAQSSSSGALNIFSNDGSFMDQFRKLSGVIGYFIPL